MKALVNSVEKIKDEVMRMIKTKKTKDGKIVPLCDYEGTCQNKAYREVYPSLLKGKYKKRGWSYLCKKHYYE